MSLIRMALIFCFVLRASIVGAHEVWIEPLDWSVTPGTEVQAHLRNGRKFKCIDLSRSDKSTMERQIDGSRRNLAD